MCGIAGLISGGRTAPNLIGRMIGPLAHRGPDDEGVWVDKAAGVGLGHRRLSIVDLSPAGHEPMISDSSRLVVTFNGEIYNHEQLRARLDSEGQAPGGGWRGNSDIETLLHAIDCWGLDRALGEAVGMFAFALWDRGARTLSLVRDRFGEKPLYYGWVGGDFAFASELRALRAHPRFDNDIDRRALAAFAARTYVPAPLSIYKRTFKLEPGCILEITPDACKSPRDDPPQQGDAGDGLSFRRYWTYADVVRRGLANPVRDRAEALELLEGALGDAIRGQSVADVPVGAFLSGGIDSSSVVALYQKYSPAPVRTFTIGFYEPGFNEAEQAKAVAARLGTIHHERYVTVEEARNVIPLLPSIYDEPFADSSQIPTFLVSRIAREQVTVALSGDGGDELFGGYRRHTLVPEIWNAARRLPLPVRSSAGRLLSSLPASFWTAVASLIGKRGSHWGGAIQEVFRAAGSSRTFDELYFSFLDEWAFERSPAGRESRVAAFELDPGVCAPLAVRGMFCDALSYLPDDILCKVDRAAMAVSLETRVPFLDHRVAEVAAKIPVGLKIRGKTGKLILRDLLARELPRELFERPKSGFSVPIGEWIKGPLRDWAEDLLDPDAIRAQGWFDAEPIAARWQQHLAGTHNWTPALWSILMFQAWLRNQKSVAAAAA
jgi:asparagine synthase (glutamine-hydrolysing)